MVNFSTTHYIISHECKAYSVVILAPWPSKILGPFLLVYTIKLSLSLSHSLACFRVPISELNVSLNMREFTSSLFEFSSFDLNLLSCPQVFEFQVSPIFQVPISMKAILYLFTLTRPHDRKFQFLFISNTGRRKPPVRVIWCLEVQLLLSNFWVQEQGVWYLVKYSAQETFSSLRVLFTITIKSRCYKTNQWVFVVVCFMIGKDCSMKFGTTLYNPRSPPPSFFALYHQL